MIINRHEDCVGITLFKWGQRRIELWFCPSGYKIEEHSHPQEDVELMFLYGNTLFCRQKTDGKTPVESYYAQFPGDFGRVFTVKHDDSHWFNVGNKPLIFLNFQTFLKGYQPVSAATDFKPKEVYARTIN